MRSSAYQNWAKLIRQFVTYGAIGVLAMVIDFFCTYSFTEYFGFYYLLSIALAFCIASLMNFAFQKRFTFACKSEKVMAQYCSFFIIGLIGMLINMVVVFAGVRFLGLWYMYGKVVATFLAFIWNFGANKIITFRTA